MSDDAELDYAYLAQHALRGVVREVLSMTADLGDPPGEHHFYVEFLTGYPGVSVSQMLKAQYPERMTIVLQHQFEDLAVYGDHFEVTLHFKGVPDRLVVPFDAVVQFADPSVNFALQFPMVETMEETSDTQVENHRGAAEPVPLRRPDAHASDDDDGPDDDGPDSPAPPDDSPQTTADVVSIDRFRKK